MTHPTHTVVKGETLYGIGKLYGVSPELLVEYNPWAKDGVKAGQELILVPSVPTDPPAREQSADDIVAGAFSASNHR
jgi:LysM repeat protein